MGIDGIRAGSDTMTAPAHTERGQPVIAVLLPARLRSQILSRQAERQLASFARVSNPRRPEITVEELPELLDGAVACLTGWGTPALTNDLLSGCTRLRLVAHTAGSIRALVPPSALERGLRVSHAAAIIAAAVAEFVVLQVLMCLRHLDEIDRRMKAADRWETIREKFPGRLLASQTVGVVGGGHVGRDVIRLFRAFGCRVLLYDPLIGAERAAALGVESRTLADLLAQADVVTLHAPVLPETRGMIGAAELARLRDGAMFVNTARAALVDEHALERELESGRLVAALDVFTDEPLPVDNPLRGLPNVVLSPHAAGHTVETYLRQGQAMVDEVQRFVRGEPLCHEIAPELYPVMA